MNSEEYKPGLHKLIHHQEHLAKIESRSVVGPIHVSVWPNNQCNFTCKYCCFANVGRDTIQLSFEDFVTGVDALKKYGLKALEFSGGGNPIMWKHFIEGVDYAHSKGLKLSLVTNGPINMVKQEPLAKFTWIRISIQSPNHARTANIDYIPDGPRKSMSFIVFDERTLKAIGKLYDFAKGTGNIVRVAPIRPCEQSWADKVEEEVKKFGKPLLFFEKPSGSPQGCYFAWIRGAIDWNGQYLPCPSIELSPESFGKIPDDFPVCHVSDLEKWLINNPPHDLGYRCTHCNCGKEVNNYVHSLLQKVEDVEFV